MSHGVLDNNVVRLTKLRGKYFRFLGVCIEGKSYLCPEEAVFLAEGNRLQVWDKGLPLSVQQLYDQLFDEPTYHQYLIYARLSRLGFALIKRTLLPKPTKYVRTSKKHGIPPQSVTVSACVNTLSSPLKSADIISDLNSIANPKEVNCLTALDSVYTNQELMTTLQSTLRPHSRKVFENTCPEFIYDAYSRSGTENEYLIHFSKRHPFEPDLIISKRSPTETYPDISEEDFIPHGLNPSTRVILSVVDGGDMSFHSIVAFNIPTLRFNENYTVDFCSSVLLGMIANCQQVTLLGCHYGMHKGERTRHLRVIADCMFLNETKHF
ncbi:unnamed protein product [Calicophoron daubneyi]